MALAGPASNLLIALLALAIIRVGVAGGIFVPPESVVFDRVVAAANGSATHGAAFMLSVFFSLNVVLAALNLIPLPPLDGSGVIMLGLPEQTARKYQVFLRNNAGLRIVGMVVAWQLFGVMYHPLFLAAVILSGQGCARLLRTDGHGQAGQSPIRKPRRRPPRAVAMFPQRRYGIEGIDAIRAAAVRDHFAAPGQFLEASLHLGHGHGDGAGNMAGIVFLAWANVDDGRRTVPEPTPQLRQRDRLERVMVVQEESGHLLDLGEARVAEGLKGPQESLHLHIGQPVEDVRALLARLDQPGLAQHAQMGARVLDGGVRVPGEALDRLLSLTEEIEEFDALGAGEGVADAGELRVQGVLELAMGHGSTGGSAAGLVDAVT